MILFKMNRSVEGIVLVRWPSFSGCWKACSACSQHEEHRAMGPKDKMEKVLKDMRAHAVFLKSPGCQKQQREAIMRACTIYSS